MNILPVDAYPFAEPSEPLFVRSPSHQSPSVPTCLLSSHHLTGKDKTKQEIVALKGKKPNDTFEWESFGQESIEATNIKS